MLSNFIRKFTVSSFVYLHMFEWSVFNLEIGMFMSAFYCQAEQTSLSLLFRYETNMKYPSHRYGGSCLSAQPLGA